MSVVLQPRYTRAPPESGVASPRRFGEAPGALPWPWRGGPTPQRGVVALAAGHGRARRPWPPARRRGGPVARCCKEAPKRAENRDFAKVLELGFRTSHVEVPDALGLRSDA
jgi:hypothetical protein